MKYSKQWLKATKQLCETFGPEDGVDPRYLARVSDKKTKQHKNRPLCKQTKRILSLVLTGELGDQKLQDLEIVDVSANEHGQFLNVFVKSKDTNMVLDENAILARLQAIQGYLRCVIAQLVKRKHAPTIKFKLVHVAYEENSYAYSKNN